MEYLFLAFIPFVWVLIDRWLQRAIDRRVDALLEERIARVIRETKEAIAIETDRLDADIAELYDSLIPAPAPEQLQLRRRSIL